MDEGGLSMTTDGWMDDIILSEGILLIQNFNIWSLVAKRKALGY